MENNPLALVPFNDLMEEIESRCKTFVAAYMFEDPQEKHDIKSWFGKGLWKDAVFLADNLHNSCLNDWSGELRKLQKIAEEENED